MADSAIDGAMEIVLIPLKSGQFVILPEVFAAVEVLKGVLIPLKSGQFVIQK